MWWPFSHHTMHQSLDSASCSFCMPSNYFNSNVCVFELFQLAESWIIMRSYLLHLEMLKALFFPLPRSTWTARASDIPIVSCVAWRFILNTSFILGSWEALWKQESFQIFCTNVAACCKPLEMEYGYSVLLIWVSVVSYWLLRLPAHCNKGRDIENPLKKGSYF